jgi:hypothetical protein
MKKTLVLGSLLAVFLMLMLPVSSTVQYENQEINNSVGEIVDKHNTNAGSINLYRHYFFGRISNLFADIENGTYEFDTEGVMNIRITFSGIREWSFEIGFHTNSFYFFSGFNFRGYISDGFIFGYFY